MPPGMLHVVKLKKRSAQIVIWRDDDVFRELNFAFPVFSEHVEERDVRGPNGSLLGKDHWGYLNTGERWRYVTFRRGDAMGYWPTRPKESGSLDQVINSACSLPGLDTRMNPSINR
jgi:hypothetical protein